jgi:hypothetical protein
MKTSTRFSFGLSLAAVVSYGVAVSSAWADQITLRNGDILNGKVVNMSTNSLVLQDDSLGALTLPRAKVANITFGTTAAGAPQNALSDTMSSQTNPSGQTNSFSDLKAIAQEIREHSNLVQEVEAQVLGSSASPAADSKFNEILDELSSGQMDMKGLRSQVQSAADQLQEYKKEMGSDAGEEVDAYLAILNSFLRETAPTNGP